MTVLAASQFVLILGLIWLLDRRHTQALEANRVEHDQHARELMAVLEQLNGQTSLLAARVREPHPDLSELTGIIDRLCQRVQAPEQAVIDHSVMQPLPPMPQPALPDDDAQFWRDQGFAPEPTKEELAAAYDTVPD